MNVNHLSVFLMKIYILHPNRPYSEIILKIVIKKVL